MPPHVTHSQSSWPAPMTVTDSALERAALALLCELIDLQPSARQARLDDCRQANPALFSRVQTLLAQVHEEEARGSDDHDDNVNGLHIGPYRVRGRLGRGGMGEVFLAERADGAFERQVALKRIWGGLAQLTERFLRERQVLARLQHPGIAQLFDGGVTDSGQPWFAMELVRGEPISHWCDARRLPVSERVEQIRQLSEAVQFAHTNLIVHRDIKPANVLIDEDGNPKLLDFGIARLMGEVDSQAPQTLAMTPAWAAPEQRSGGALTTATDIWQLGTLLRVLLSGELPRNDAPQPRMAAGYAALRRRDAAAAAAIADQRNITSDGLQSLLTGDLDSIVAVATADEPDQRYASAQAFAEDLERWQQGLPVQARRHERGYRARRALRRHWPVLTAGVGVLLLAFGLGAYHVQRLNRELDRTETALARAAAERMRADTQRERAEETIEYFVQMFKQARPRDIAGGEVTARELLATSLRQLHTDRTHDPLVRASLLHAASRAVSTLGDYAEAERGATAAIALMNAHPGVDPDEMARARLNRSTYLQYLQRLPEAEREITAAIAIAESTPLRDPDLPTFLYLHAANVASARDQSADVRRAYARVLELTRAGLQRPKACRQHYAALGNLAMLDIDAYLPTDAERRLREAIALAPRCGIKDPIDGFMLRRVLAAALLDQGKLEEASALSQKVLAESQRFLAAGDPFLMRSQEMQALVDLAAGRPQPARIVLEAVDKQERVALGNEGSWRMASRGLLEVARLETADSASANAAAADRLGALMPALRIGLAAGNEGARERLRFYEIALAYANCRRSPDPRSVAVYREMRERAKPLRGWRTPMLERWNARCH